MHHGTLQGVLARSCARSKVSPGSKHASTSSNLANPKGSPTLSVTPPHPLRGRSVNTINPSSKTGCKPGLKPSKYACKREIHNKWTYSSTATCRSSPLDGSHTRNTQPNIHNRVTCRNTITNLQMMNTQADGWPTWPYRATQTICNTGT